LIDMIFITGGARSGKSAFAEKLAREKGNGVTYIATAQISDNEMQARVSAHRKRRPAAWNTVESADNLPEAVAQALAAGGTVLVDCLTVYLANLLLKTTEPELFAQVGTPSPSGSASRCWRGQAELAPMAGQARLVAGQAEMVREQASLSACDAQASLATSGISRALEIEVDRLVETCRKGEEGTGDRLVIVSNEVGMGIVPQSAVGRLFRDVAGRANQKLAAAANEVYLCVSGIPLKVK
jgi:adenosylcobinamide kinase/adenosylcobinamide-phosphate guanylyltransferase